MTGTSIFVYFDTNKYDIVINRNAKRFFSKGYRAFFNEILSLSLLEYIKERGKYSPDFLAIDSPILSLKEKDDDITPDTMKMLYSNISMITNS